MFWWKYKKILFTLNMITLDFSVLWFVIAGEQKFSDKFYYTNRDFAENGQNIIYRIIIINLWIM